MRGSAVFVLADLTWSARRPRVMWSTFAADHALTLAIVDVTRGLRADLTKSAFHLENVAAPGFQQGVRPLEALVYVRTGSY